MPNLGPLLKARSIAVVGASPRPEAFGWFALRQLIDSGFAGRIFPVNPGYPVIEGLACYPSLAELPAPVDCAAICVADARLEAALADVAAVGVPAAVIYGSAAGDVSTGQPLSARLAEIAQEHDIALMGASCMGFFNFSDRVFLTGYPYHREPQPGTIAFITHSGSTLSAVTKNTRDMRFNYVISPGQELVLTAADYLDFVVDQSETRVVGLFLEAIRDPVRFRQALSRAEERDIPVVLLKVGRSERGAEMALAHTGALAGAQAVIEAVASRHNLVLVRTIEEMLDTLELFNAGRRPTTFALGSIHDSGGERGMLVDLAADIGMPFAELGPATMGVLEQTLDPGLHPGNPADLWGSGQNWQYVYRTCIDAMLADPAVGAFNYGIDFNIGSRLGPDYKQIAIEAFQTTTKPFAVITNVTSGIDPDLATELRESGIPVLMGTETGLLAFDHLFRYERRRAVSRNPANATHGAPTIDLPTNQSVLGEAESLTVFGRWGLPAVPFEIVSSASELGVAADRLGYPLVLKTAEPGVLHKSDVQGVKTGIGNLDDVHVAYADLAARIGPRVVLQPQADLTAGVELILGATWDEQFGALVTVGLGGIFVEVLADALSFLAPVPAVEVLDRLPTLAGYRMLTGARGKSPVDLEKLAYLVERFSTFAAGLAGPGCEIDANPVLATGSEFLILDGLIVLPKAE